MIPSDYAGRKWRAVTLNAKPGTSMEQVMTRVLAVMKALKNSCVVYACTDKTHLHILYRGFYLHQRSWSEIFKICSNGSYITWVKEIKSEQHFSNLIGYMREQAKTEKFINWDKGIKLEEFMT
ncbi:hypothetical protein ES705_38391 [subsurface metagenome]